MDSEHDGRVGADRRRGQGPRNRRAPARCDMHGRRGLAGTMRQIMADLAREHTAVEDLLNPPSWFQWSTEGMVSCLMTATAMDAEEVAGLLRLERDDPEELRKLWALVEQRRRAIRQHELQRRRERREFEAAEARRRRALAAPAPRRRRPVQARQRHPRRCGGRRRGRGAGAPRASRAGPAGELPGEGDDGEPSPRGPAVAGRSRGGA